MKTIHAKYDDAEFRKLEKTKKKEDLSWEEFIFLGKKLIDERRERINEHHEEEGEAGIL